MEKYDPSKTYPRPKNAWKTGNIPVLLFDVIVLWLFLGGYTMMFIKQEGYSKACKNVFSQITTKLAKGEIKQVASISKPIQMSDSSSYLEIIANQFYESHSHFVKAHQHDKPVQTMKHLMAAVNLIFLTIYEQIAGLTANLHNLLGRIPLDAMLGETYQGVHSDGTGIYIECVSSYPPIHIVTVRNQKTGLEILSKYCAFATINGVNSVCGGSNGYYVFKDKKGKEYKISHGSIVLDGMIYGDPVFNLLGDIQFSCLSEKLEGTLTFDGYKNDYAVTKIAKGLFGMFGGSGETKLSDSISIVIRESEGDKKVIAKGSGSWLSHIEIDGMLYWKYRERVDRWDRPEEPVALLPSDARLRQDKKLLVANKIKEAQEAKMRYESQEEYDRNLRQKGSNTKS